MTFKDEQKQAEFEAFAAYYRLVAQRPHTAAKMSRMNQLESIIRGDYPGALQELRAEQRIASAQQAQERQLGKHGGGALTRRGSSPEPRQPRPAAPGSQRAQRQAAREAQKSKSAAPVVVAADKPKNQARGKAVKLDLALTDTHDVKLSTGATFNVETGRTENDMVQDAVNLNAKDLVEKYGRDLIFEYLIVTGEDRENLEQKTDRQLANFLKRAIQQ